MNASLSFPSQTNAELKVEASDFIFRNGTLALVGFIVIACLLLAIGDLFPRILGGLIFVAVPFVWREISNAMDRADCMIEIDRQSLAVTRVVGSEATSKPVGGFIELQLHELIIPGRGSRPLYELHMVCKTGIVKLFQLESKEEVSRLGTSLAEWLEVPLKDQGPVLSLKLASLKSIV